MLHFLRKIFGSSEEQRNENEQPETDDNSNIGNISTLPTPEAPRKEEEPTDIADTVFPSPMVDEMFRTMVKHKGLKATLNNEGTEWRVTCVNIVEAISLFYKLDDVNAFLLERSNRQDCGIYLKMRVRNERSIEFKTFPNNDRDIAEINYLEQGKKVKGIRFVKEL